MLKILNQKQRFSQQNRHKIIRTCIIAFVEFGEKINFKSLMNGTEHLDKINPK